MYVATKSWITISCKHNIGCLFRKVPERLVPDSAYASLSITMLVGTTILLVTETNMIYLKTAGAS